MLPAKKFIPGIGRFAKFVPRHYMTRRLTKRRAHLPFGVPATKLPVDATNNGLLACPMDDNDTLGDCMYAMACHSDNLWTYGIGQWTESTFDTSAIQQCYEALSGGDNGLDEPTLLGNAQTPGSWYAGLCGNPLAVVVNAMDFDCTDTVLTQYLIDQFLGFQFMWSVPDAFIQGFANGTSWDCPQNPDPANGHGVLISDIDVNGRMRLWTWGNWCWVTPCFLGAVQPGAFVTFSPRQFNPLTGLDAKGRHITIQASVWTACGGSPIPQSVINAFPPIGPQPPGPGPVPIPPPGPTPAPPPPNSGLTLTVNAAVGAGKSAIIGLDYMGATESTLSAPIAAGSYTLTPALMRRR
jgi:hypothetical protein